MESSPENPEKIPGISEEFLNGYAKEVYKIPTRLLRASRENPSSFPLPQTRHSERILTENLEGSLSISTETPFKWRENSAMLLHLFLRLCQFVFIVDRSKLSIAFILTQLRAKGGAGLNYRSFSWLPTVLSIVTLVPWFPSQAQFSWCYYILYSFIIIETKKNGITHSIEMKMSLTWKIEFK